jgi:hypothetical protein
MPRDSFLRHPADLTWPNRCAGAARRDDLVSWTFFAPWPRKTHAWRGDSGYAPFFQKDDPHLNQPGRVVVRRGRGGDNCAGAASHQPKADVDWHFLNECDPIATDSVDRT